MEGFGKGDEGKRFAIGKIWGSEERGQKNWQSLVFVPT